MTFRRVERPAVGDKATRWGTDRHLLSLVLLDFDCGSEEKRRMREVEAWARDRSEEVRLLRVTKK